MAEKKEIVVETLEDFDFTPEARTRRSQYDWEMLFDGKIHKVTGVAKTFETTVQRNADKVDWVESVAVKRVDDDTVVLQATTK
jgi:hypothetical protein